MNAIVKDKEERKLKKAKIALMRNPLFALWQGVLMVGTTEVVDNIPTARTNGRDEQYGRKFVHELNDKELRFVVAHECMHKALRHMTVYKRLDDIDRDLAGQAMDYVINLDLVNLDPDESLIAMPRLPNGELNGLLDKKFANMSTKQVFDILLQQKKQGGGQGEGTGGKGTGGNGQGESGFDEHDWDGAGQLSQAEEQQLTQDIANAIRQGQIAASKLNGKGGANMSRDLMDLLYPEIDWREALREFVTSTCPNKDTSSWRRINRRLLPLEIYMPSLIGESVGHIVAGSDTSGSVSSIQTTKMVTELQRAMETVSPDRLDMLYWDSYVEKHEVYEGGNTSYADTTRPTGGGGTEPKCVIKYLKEKAIAPECIIMLTDGYIGANDWGMDWPAPVLWIILDNKDCQPPCGKTIHVTSEQMME